jgi:hypothetical protein
VLFLLQSLIVSQAVLPASEKEIIRGGVRRGAESSADSWLRSCLFITGGQLGS